MPQRPEVAAQRLQAVEERPDPVARREHEPVELAETADRAVERLVIVERADLDGGRDQDLGPHRLQGRRRAVGLVDRAGDDDPLAEQGAVLEPSQRVASRHHLAHDQQGRGPEARLGHPRGKVVERRGDRPLPRERPRLDQGGGGRARLAQPDQGAADARQAGHAHVDDQGPGEPRQGRPVEPAVPRRRLGVAVPGDERDGRGGVAVRDRHARVGGHADPRRHPRHHLERQARGAQVLGLLRPPAEDERVAPLEPDHPTALAGVLGQDGVDLLLRQRAMADRLARADPQAAGRGEVEQPGAGQVVVDDHLGAAEDLLAPTGEQARVAGAGADQVDDPAVLAHPATLAWAFFFSRLATSRMPRP